MTKQPCDFNNLFKTFSFQPAGKRKERRGAGRRAEKTGDRNTRVCMELVWVDGLRWSELEIEASKDNSHFKKEAQDAPKRTLRRDGTKGPGNIFSNER